MNEQSFVAMARAFRACRLNHEKSRTVCAYLARQWGCDCEQAEMDAILDQWYAKRTADATYKPASPTEEQPHDANTQPMASSDSSGHEGSQEDIPVE